MTESRISELANGVTHAASNLFHSVMDHESNLFSHVMHGSATNAQYLEAGAQTLVFGALALKGPKVVESIVAESETKALPVGIVGLGGGFDREALEKYAVSISAPARAAERLSGSADVQYIEFPPAQGLDMAAFLHPEIRPLSLSIQHGDPDNPTFTMVAAKAIIKGVNLNVEEK
jgi:hypothetical protein